MGNFGVAQGAIEGSITLEQCDKMRGMLPKTMEGGYDAGKKINLVIAVKITPLYFKLKKKLQKDIQVNYKFIENWM